MRTMAALLLISCSVLGGCGTGAPGAGGTAPVSAATASGEANVFNPFVRSSLPTVRKQSAEGRDMVRQLGGEEPSLAREAAHRPLWKHEIYPVFFGQPAAPHEVLVLLDFANAQSATVWHAVVQASRAMSPQQGKIVVLANSGEQYGTDLMGLGIWIARTRPGQAMGYMTYALERWNAAKAAQKKARGRAVDFQNEYAAVAAPSDLPIHYTYMLRLRPPVPASEELAVSRYSYDAGNINMYQATQIARYFGVRALPAVIVDGRPLASVSASAILDGIR